MNESRSANPPSRGRLLRSLGYALRGVAAVLATQANARIHAAATLVVIAAGWWLRLSALEWCAVILAIGGVWVAETFNTAIETLVDLASPEHHPLAGRAKDVAAGAVLCASITAVAVASIIFLPKLVAVFRATP